MSNLEPLLERNRAFAETGAHLGQTPQPNLGTIIVTCFDSRLDPSHLLGTDHGDLVVIRNDGGRATDDVVAQVTYIATLLETVMGEPAPGFEVAFVHHTNCMTGLLATDEVRIPYAERIGVDEASLVDRAVIDPAATVTTDVASLRANPAIPPSVTITGHVYDVETGLISTVVVDNPADDEIVGVCEVQNAN